MWLVFVFFIFVIIGLLLSNINLVIRKIIFDEKHHEFNIDINFLFFKIIRIFSIHFDMNGVYFLNKKISYKKIITSEKFKTLKLDVKKTEVNEFIQILKELKIKINKAKFSLKIGAEDIFLTSLLVVIISSFISILFRIKFIEFNLKNINYHILPEFNKFKIQFDGNITISLSVFLIIKIILKNLYEKKKHNSKILPKSIRIEN
ncbi:MAG: DUF2953 domain-containing protein [Clostridia bacterium]|nr:DUF2953 domain-containing protein [Clostridia bacterium]